MGFASCFLSCGRRNIAQQEATGIPGEFEVKQKLGRGGEGEIFLVAAKDSRKQFALKVVARSPNLNAKHLLSEIRVQSVLRHACIVRLHEVLLHRSALVLKLQYVPGQSMAEYLKTVRPVGANELLPEPTARFFLRQVVSALLHVRAHNAAHRDIKLSNIIVDTTRSRDAPRLMLCDFGLAVDCDDDICLHRSYTTVGTRQYMSPELLANHGTTKRKAYMPTKVDVWGLGVLLYVFVVGRLPFQTNRGPPNVKFDMMMESVRAGHFDLCTDPTKDMFYNTHMSPECRALIQQMLALNPDTRITLDDVVNNVWMQGPVTPVQQAELHRIQAESLQLASTACRLPRCGPEYKVLEDLVRHASSGLESHAHHGSFRLGRASPLMHPQDEAAARRRAGRRCGKTGRHRGQQESVLQRWSPPEGTCHAVTTAGFEALGGAALDPGAGKTKDSSADGNFLDCLDSAEQELNDTAHADAKHIPQLVIGSDGSLG